LLTTQTGTAVCTQLRLANSLLQRRSWTASLAPAGNSWQTFASGITAVGQPFSVVAAGPDGHQRLVVNVAASAGGVRDTQSRKAAVSFTSLNSTVNGAAPDQCSQYRLVA